MDYKELGITEQQMREIDNIFSNAKLLECMERGLTNSGKPTPPSVADERVDEAIEAFSNNPPEFWEMLGSCPVHTCSRGAIVLVGY